MHINHGSSGSSGGGGGGGGGTVEVTWIFRNRQLICMCVLFDVNRAHNHHIHGSLGYVQCRQYVRLYEMFCKQLLFLIFTVRSISFLAIEIQYILLSIRYRTANHSLTFDDSSRQSR